MAEFFSELLNRLSKKFNFQEFVSLVRERVSTLSDDADPTERAGTLECACPLCTAAKAYSMHMDVVGNPQDTNPSCLCHNWTFIMPDSAEDLKKAVEFAKQYEPAVIFVEDIDSVVKGERSVDMDGILNIVDGAESKGRELMIVLTTNHPDLINKAMLRPGRIDALIEVAPPDAYAAEKLIRVYARDLLATGEDITEAGKLLAGHKPASIREIVERSKLAAIFNHGDDADHIDCNDLVTAVNIMKPHFALMEEKVAVEDTSLDALFKKMMREVMVPEVPPNGTKKAQEARA